MIITTECLLNAFYDWASNDLMNKSSPFQKGVLTFVLLQGKPSISKMFDNLNFLSDNGEFESEVLFENLEKALTQMGGEYKLPLIDYNFDVEDLKKVKQYLRGTAL